MRIISKKRLQEFWGKVPNSRKPLEMWHKLAVSAECGNFSEAKTIFGSIDTVKVGSGNTVTVFDIGGNKYRLIAAVHYNKQRCFVLRVLTHKEYDEEHWKEQL